MGFQVQNTLYIIPTSRSIVVIPFSRTRLYFYMCIYTQTMHTYEMSLICVIPFHLNLIPPAFCRVIIFCKKFLNRFHGSSRYILQYKVLSCWVVTQKLWYKKNLNCKQLVILGIELQSICSCFRYNSAHFI